MATEGDSKKLSDLRVVDLRAELGRRGLDKTGIKANLIERLQKALIEERKDPEEYEFDLSDKKSTKRLSPSTRSEENDTNADQSANDPSILMIETPSLDTGFDTVRATVKAEKDGNEKKDDNTGAESLLNLSIGEEEKNLLMNSGHEQERSTEEIKVKIEDAKITISNHGASSVNAKELENTTKEHDEDKDDDEGTNADEDAEEETTNRDEAVAEGSRSNSSKNEDTASTTKEVRSTGASAVPASTTTTTSQSKKNEKDKDKNSKSNPGRSLWITNLLPSTRAQELKHLLSRYGKVIGAKVVQSSRYPRQRCYVGYVTMETRAAADLCIQKLNNTELKGQIIRVAKVRPEHSLPLKAQKHSDSKEKDKKNKSSPEKNGSDSSPEKKKVLSPSDKNNDDQAKKDSREGDRESRNPSRSGSAKKNRSLSKSSGHRPDRKSEIFTFDKIRGERERQRQHERERAKREEGKRRREIQHAREIEKRQREEAMRLEREREKLRMERERLDRQRVEILRLERERQRLEREKLEQEKQELRRQQLRLEEARRPVKRPSSTTTTTYRRDSATYTDDRKRIATDWLYDETPPPPRFEVATREPASEISNKKEIPKDYKSRIAYAKRSEEYPKRSSDFKRKYPPTERHSGGHPSHIVHSINNATRSSKYESSSYVNLERERDIREAGRRETIIPNVPPPRISKDARYGECSGERSPVSYRPVRDERRERRPVTDHHTKDDVRSSRDHRYPETAMKEETRYREGNSWHSSSAPTVKSFSGISGSTSSSREPWSKSDNWRPMETSLNERWGNSSSRLIMSSSSGVPNTMYSGGNSNMSGIGPGLACSPPPGNSSYPMDRFDSYKSINSSRKY